MGHTYRKCLQLNAGSSNTQLVSSTNGDTENQPDCVRRMQPSCLFPELCAGLTANPKSTTNHYFKRTLHTTLLLRNISNEVLSMRSHPREPWEQASMTRTVIQMHFKKNEEYSITCPHLFQPQRGAKGMYRAESSPFSCSKRPLSKEMHQATITICAICC